MFIDTHCHLTDRYTKDPDAIVMHAAKAGVGALVCATAEPDDFAPAIALAEKHKNVFVTIGIHPEYAGKTMPDYGHLLSHPKVVGVGEIGLDFHYEDPFVSFADDDAKTEANREPVARNAQIELFRKQLGIAVRAGLPVAIHSRKAREDTVEILCAPEYAGLGGGGAPGVMHFHCMPWEFTKKLLDRGFYFSATGIITFKNADAEREVFSKIPLDRIVIETDAPWCAPVPFRGKECTPAMVVETAKVLAEIRNIPLQELEVVLEQNTKKLYPKLSV
ncbi:MAG: TatD family hydrolase [Alphaproteobacteria bacterium]|nr:TatD family hydrolase [Alphaproteobacteria bacterium]